jgi:hypothetical protein
MNDERPITDYGRLIEEVVTTDDPNERRRKGRLLGLSLERALGHSVDVQQAVRFETEEWLRQRMGETNDLISEVKGGFDGVHAALADFRSSQEAVLDAARAEFHSGLNAVGESVSQVGRDLATVSNDVADLKLATIAQDNFNHSAIERLDRIEGRQSRDGKVLQQQDTRIANLEAYAESMPQSVRAELVMLIKSNAEAIATLQSDLEKDRRDREADQNWKEEVIQQLADVLEQVSKP